METNRMIGLYPADEWNSMVLSVKPVVTEILEGDKPKAETKTGSGLVFWLAIGAGLYFTMS